MPLCCGRGYAENSDHNYCKDRYEEISNESKDGKDAFNAVKVGMGKMLSMLKKGTVVKEPFNWHYAIFKGMSYGWDYDYEIIYFEWKGKEYMLSKKMIWIAVPDLSS